MSQGRSFQQILEEHLKESPSFTEEPPFSYPEHPLRPLWAEVLPLMKDSSSPRRGTQKAYPKRKLKQTSSAESPTPLKPKPQVSRLLLVMTRDRLSLENLLHLEILVRGGWISRQEIYTLAEWKQAHRKAVRALHPDSGAQVDPAEFSSIHEAFKKLRGDFTLQAQAA